MNPLMMFILGILSPLVMATTLFVPPYVGIAAASYVIYAKHGEVNPLSGKLDNVFYMIDVYVKLFTQWAHHIGETSVLNYALPLLILPILSVMFALWFTSKVATKLKDIFQHGASL